MLIYIKFILKCNYYTCCFVAYSFIPYGVLNGIVFFQISYRTLLNYFISRVAPELEMRKKMESLNKDQDRNSI